MLDGQRWTENLAYPETSQTIQKEAVSESSQRPRPVNYFRKELHARRSTRF